MRHTVRLAVLLLLPPLAGFASEWEIDPAHTMAQFSVKHMMVTNVRGSLGKVSGTLNLDDKNPTRSTVEVAIDATTLSTGVTKRDDHLRSPDFFDVQQFPTVTFKSTKVTGSKGKYKMTGDLTIHGVTKSVVLDVDAPDTEQVDMMNVTRRGFTATAKVNRKDFGLTWNKALEKGGVLVGDDVNISIEAEFTKKPEGGAAAKEGAK